MNKEQQIEQMAKIINELYCVYTTTETDIAEVIYQAGYRKIDENCAVITKDELKLYQRQSVKEFAEKLKEYPLESKNLVWEYGEGWLDCYKTVKKAIDELLKEYE